MSEPGIGHNSVAADQLRLFIERVERLEDEKRIILEDIRDIYTELKATGLDPRTVREIVRLRKLESNTRQEREILLETYKAALGLA